MSKLIYILNGPNLNLLGSREPEVYGKATLKDVEALCQVNAKKHGLEICFLQSNHEGALVDWIQEARTKAAGIIINPAAYSHTSIAILDALKMFCKPIVEVHISNIHQREAFRHHSFVSSCADAVIAGCGIQGYGFALDFIEGRF